MSIVKKMCFKVVCNTTNSSNNTVSRGEDPADPPYLDCEERELYVMANSLAEVETIVGPNAKIVAKVGICYATPLT